MKKTGWMAILSLLVFFGWGCTRAPIDTQGRTESERDRLELCQLPEGIEVVSLSLDPEQAGELSDTGATGMALTVELNRTVAVGEAVAVCFAVRDAQVGGGPLLAMGFVGVPEGWGPVVDYPIAFQLICDEGKVAGQALLPDLASFDGSSGERKTRIYVQHASEIRQLGSRPVGFTGVKSNRIKMECPRD